MKAQELRELTEDELQQKEKDLADQLFKLRFQHAVGQVENAMKLRTIRRDLARIKTVRKEKGRRKE
ncbi:MAG: 50S ribosomal protein L29 [Candidatus Aminicenantes bacterium RBG_19FT_COMBO_58_17]|jgi:large subunit ribosomal protein L29|nr:MAG: 50S ribosomal protein L29 [Candidatus Aminicenantes bacterium RBG_19FT_COMBO_58_17]HCS49583.1 50S ribosomal protein L29 [Candidatus Aminicenantes bacterium]